MASAGFITAAEEQRLATAVQATGCLASRNRLAMSHLPLARRLARREASRSLDPVGADGEAMLALLEAAARFRPGVVRFRAFASGCIRAALRTARRGEHRTRARTRDLARERRWDAGHPDEGREAARRAVLTAVASLPREERDALEARHGLGRPPVKIDRRQQAACRRAEQKVRDQLAG